jgi:hypothetical protein
MKSMFYEHQHSSWPCGLAIHQKLDLPEGWHSASMGLPDEKLAVHSTWAATKLDELPAARDGTLEIWDVASESWAAASETGNADSETTGVGLASVHDLEMGLCQTDWAMKGGGACVASRMLAQKNHLAPAILFHLIYLILDDGVLVG